MLLCLCFFCLVGWWLVVATVSAPDPSPLMSTMPGQISTKGDRPACQTSSSPLVSIDVQLGMVDYVQHFFGKLLGGLASI